MEKIIPVVSLILLASCTSLKTDKVTNISNDEICVINNFSIKADFTAAYVRQIANNGYKAKLVSESDALNCPITSTYTATFGFHWGIYLATANFKIFENGELIGNADYKAPYMDVTKHGRVEGKIDKIIDELLPQI